VSILKHPAETVNRTVFIEDMKTTQNKILELLRKVAPNKKYTPKYVDVDDIKRASDEKIAKGDYSLETMYEFIYVAIFGEGYGGSFEKVDNELLGLKGKTEKDIEEILKNAVGSV